MDSVYASGIYIQQSFFMHEATDACISLKVIFTLRLRNYSTWAGFQYHGIHHELLPAVDNSTSSTSTGRRMPEDVCEKHDHIERIKPELLSFCFITKWNYCVFLMLICSLCRAYSYSSYFSPSSSYCCCCSNTRCSEEVSHTHTHELRAAPPVWQGVFAQSNDLCVMQYFLSSFSRHTRRPRL